MAGAIARLFGGKRQPDFISPPGEPQPGLGGYTLGPGRTGEHGFPGSTSQTRTFRGSNPRIAKIDADTNSGTNNAVGATTEARRAAYRADVPGAFKRGPRATPYVVTPQTQVRQNLQHNDPSEFFGGQPLRTVPGNRNVGQNPQARFAAAEGGHSVRDTETPATQREPLIGGAPGSQNVRNTYAQRYKNPAGQMHAYRSAPRGDMPGSSRGFAAYDTVTVQNRFQVAGDQNFTWSVEREMPYSGRGDGARGAALNGQRYYGTWTGQPQFANSVMGSYGRSRADGPNHRPTNFQVPAPWWQNYYDTTASVGTPQNPGDMSQSPDLVYMSPEPGRASNATGR